MMTNNFYICHSEGTFLSAGLSAKCVNAGCHPGGGGPMSLANGQSFGTLVNQNSAYNRPRVQPGNANNSALYLKVAGTTLGQIMPLGRPPLSAAEVTAIQTWINNGALNN